jgi:hypothetical protein
VQVLIQEHASFSGGEDGAVAVTLLNVGLGPALRVEVRASYIDSDYQPEIGQVTLPAIKPGESERSVLYVRFPSEPPGGIRGDGFRVSGTYLDRSRRNEYSIITDWRTPSSDPS